MDWAKEGLFGLVNAARLARIPLLQRRGFGITGNWNGAAACPPRAVQEKEGLPMMRFGTALAVVLVALCAIAGCNDYGNTFQNNTGALITSISPDSIPAGQTSDLTITVIGAGFVPKTVVQWNQKTIATTVAVDANNNVLSVTAVVPKALLASPGRAFVNTLNPASGSQNNGLSNSVAFIINVPPNPAPSLTSISPAMASPGSGDVSLTVSGAGFVQNTATNGAPLNGSVVQWNTGTSITQLSTAFGSASSLSATIPAALLTAESCASVSVFTGPTVDPNNPAANGGGGTSSSQTFTISTNSTFCPAAAMQSAVAIAEETPAVSGDGRFVAYTGQSGTHAQIFLRDTCEGSANDCKPQTTLLSRAQEGAEGNADSHNPSISSDGRYIAFSSAATNLAAETPAGKQIFLRDTCHGAASDCKPQTQLISVDPSGLLSATDNLLPSVSSSGRFVAFLSVKSATTKTIVGQANNGVRQVFVRDTCIGAASGCTPKTMRISAQPGDASSVPGKIAGPAVSGTGSAVGIADDRSATLFTRSVAVDDKVFLAITKNQN
jgi:trimeric autotransporter adhesin